MGNSIAFSRDGRHLASGSSEHHIRIHEIIDRSAQLCGRYGDHADQVRSLCFSHGGDVLASGSLDTSIRIWDFANGNLKPVQVLEGHTDTVF